MENRESTRRSVSIQQSNNDDVGIQAIIEFATAIQLAEAIICAESLPFLISAETTGMAIQGAVFDLNPPLPTTLQGFPTNGISYAVLSTGDARQAGLIDFCCSSDTGGPSGGGLFDIYQLILTFLVPTTPSTLSFNWKFGTEECGGDCATACPTDFNDVFQANVTTPTGTTNIALLPNGQPVTVNNAIPFLSPPVPNDVCYSNVTPIFTSTFDLTPFIGQTISIAFLVADGGPIGDDNSPLIDSAAFIDNLCITPNPVPPPERPREVIRTTQVYDWTITSDTVTVQIPIPTSTTREQS